MEYLDPVQALREELESARADEAQALHRAIHLRPLAEIGEAMQDVAVLHARVSRLQRALNELLH